jgi:hypothetical protein
MKPRTLLIALTFGALVPVPAVAQEGSGLYTPSPRKAGAERADRFVAELLSVRAGDRVTAPPRKALEHGIFLAPFAPAEQSAGPTQRAVADDDWFTSRVWLVALFALAAALAAAAVRRRRMGATS